MQWQPQDTKGNVRLKLWGDTFLSEGWLQGTSSTPMGNMFENHWNTLKQINRVEQVSAGQNTQGNYSPTGRFKYIIPLALPYTYLKIS